jgi:hypothetical protein
VQRDGEAGLRSGVAADDAIERPSFEVLHGHEVPIVGATDLVGLHDVRVIEARGETRLLEEHLQERPVFRQLGLQLLDDDDFVESAHPMGDRQVDDPHAASRDLRDETVLAELVAPMTLRRAG